MTTPLTPGELDELDHLITRAVVAAGYPADWEDPDGNDKDLFARFLKAREQIRRLIDLSRLRSGSGTEELDACEICHGTQGGVPGNENIICGRRVCDYCDAFAMTFRDASPAPVAAEWRPIETAPKDGRAVLVMRDIWPGTKSGHAEECNGHNTYVAEWWSEHLGPNEGGWVCYMDMVQDPDLPIEPTHWQPLPPPPAEGNKP